jgi:hypothetical protein
VTLRAVLFPPQQNAVFSQQRILLRISLKCRGIIGLSSLGLILALCASTHAIHYSSSSSLYTTLAAFLVPFSNSFPYRDYKILPLAKFLLQWVGLCATLWLSLWSGVRLFLVLERCFFTGFRRIWTRGGRSVLSTRWLLVRLLLVALGVGRLSPRVTWHASLL